MKPLLLALPILMMSCGSPTQPKAPNESTKPAPALKRSAGSEAALSISIWPAHWDVLLQQTREWSSSDKQLARMLAVVDLSTPWPVLADFGLDSKALPPVGLVAEKPLTIAFYSGSKHFEELALDGFRGIQSSTPAPVHPLRIRVSIPTTKADELAKSLGGEGVHHEDRHWRVSVVEAGVIVDVVFTYDGAGDSVFGSVPSKMPGPSFPLTHASALRLAVDVRALSDLVASLGVVTLLSAVGYADPAQQTAIMAQGTSEALGGFLLVDPQTSVSTVFMVDMAVDSAVGTQAAWRLSPLGETVTVAAGISKAKELSLSDFDLIKAINTTTLPPILESASSREMNDLVQVCGSACWLYLMAGNALQFASVLNKSGELEKLIEEIRNGMGGGVAMASRAVFDLDERGLLSLRSPKSRSAWKSLPQLATPRLDDEAERCLRKAWTGAHAGLRQVGLADPSQRLRIMRQANKAMKAQEECVGKNAAIASRHQHLAAFVQELTTAMLEPKPIVVSPVADDEPSDAKPHVVTGNAVVGGPSEKNGIRRVIRSSLPQFRACYEQELILDATLAGRVDIRFQIQPSGKAANVRATGLSKAVSDCLTKVLHTLTFSKPVSGFIEVSYPFVFKPAP